jgi:predicted metal-dependent phosphoesterase TrpH
MLTATAGYAAGVGLADLHLHTLASDGLMGVQALIDYAETQTSLDVIAITDHDEVSAALEARELVARQGYRVQIITGVEVTTRDGHLLALFLEERPPALRPMLETAEWVMRRGGICLAPHPFTRITFSLPREVMNAAADAGLLGGVEVLNSSPAGRRSQGRATEFARVRGLPQVGGSDAHMMRIVGLSHTRFPGTTAVELKQALSDGTTSAEGRFARVGEIAAEAAPQLTRSLIQLPLRRLTRLRPALVQSLRSRAAARTERPEANKTLE